MPHGPDGPDPTDLTPYRPLQEAMDRALRNPGERARREIFRAYYREERAKAERAGRGREYNDNGHGNNRVREDQAQPANMPRGESLEQMFAREERQAWERKKAQG